jgi:hypothetical protein
LIEGVAAGQRAETPIGSVSLLDAAQGAVTVAVRPEALVFEPDPDGPAALVQRRYVGGRYILGVRQGAVNAVVEVAEAPPLGSRGRLMVTRPCPVF